MRAGRQPLVALIASLFLSSLGVAPTLAKAAGNLASLTGGFSALHRAAEDATISASASIPSCRNAGGPVIRDLMTGNVAYDDWARTLVDTRLRLPASYAPPDLVPVSRARVSGSGLVRSIVVADLRKLAADARVAGGPIRVVSAYRSFGNQQSTFAGWVRAGGYDAAVRTSARPGHSEHQLGTVIDVTSLHGGNPWDYDDWATTAAGAWMADNAWRYGFVMSYPTGTSAVTCYDYEPWHFRYVGRTVAAAIHDTGLTSREWLSLRR